MHIPRRPWTLRDVVTVPIAFIFGIGLAIGCLLALIFERGPVFHHGPNDE